MACISCKWTGHRQLRNAVREKWCRAVSVKELTRATKYTARDSISQRRHLKVNSQMEFETLAFFNGLGFLEAGLVAFHYLAFVTVRDGWLE